MCRCLPGGSPSGSPIPRLPTRSPVVAKSPRLCVNVNACVLPSDHIPPPSPPLLSSLGRVIYVTCVVSGCARQTQDARLMCDIHMHVYKCKMAGSFVAVVHLLLLVALICHETKGVPRRRYGESHESSNTSYSEPYYKKNQGHIHTQRKILSKGSSYAPTSDDTNTRIDGKIIFPSDDDDDDNQPQPFVPNPNPSCENLTFCEHVQNYPNDLVETALRINKDLKLLSGVDLVPDVVHRFNSQPEDSSNSLCDSHEKVVYPKVAQNRDKEWLFIVNQGDFTQGVRVETCKNENNACNVIDGFAEGYKTLCKQKYIYRQLVAVSNVGHVKPEMFRFPASCCCHIKFTGNPYVRIGISANKKSELPTSKARRK